MFDLFKEQQRIFEEVSKQYDSTLGKFINMMNMGINLESLDEQQKAMDAYYKLLISTGNLASIMAKSGTDGVKSIGENYCKMISEGQHIEDFKELYDLWYQTNEKNMVELFSTETFSKAFCDFSDKYFKYIAANNAVLERYLSKLPIPTNKDMNSLYLTVFNMRKEIRDLQKDVEKIKTKPAAQSVEENGKA